MCLGKQVMAKFYTSKRLQESDGSKNPTLCANSLTLSVCQVSIILSYSGCSDDSDEEDTTPAERVRGLEDEDVLEEECVQLCQLPQDHKDINACKPLE